MPCTEERKQASISAGLREIDELRDKRGRANMTVNRIAYAISQIEGNLSLDENRQLLKSAEHGMKVLRSEIQFMRRQINLIDTRRERRENGTYIP